jgi:CBS domain-containing protein
MTSNVGVAHSLQIRLGYFPMKVHDIMSTRARCVGPANTLVEAAGVMRLFGVGAVPICDDDRVIGMLTDRDIVLHGVANGGDLNQVTVLDLVSENSDPIIPLYEDDEVENAAVVMEECQASRLPVVDREQHLVGMVCRADFALRSRR